MSKPLNILQFICPTGFYGAERWILALANNSDQQCNRHHLAVTEEPGMKDLELVKHFQHQGGPVHTVTLRNKFDLNAIAQLCDIIKQNDIDVIHTHGYKSDILGVIAAKKTGIKSVCTPHGFENASDLKLRTFIWLGCQSMRFFDAVAPLSKQLCDDAKRYGVTANKLHYIQNGVDLSEVEAVRDQSIKTPTTTKRVGFIGQMISRKNIKDLLTIFDKLQAKHGNIELLLLGDGDSRAELEAYTRTLKSQPAIQFLGFRDDRLALLHSFDLFVMSSSLEGIPRCLMEAMAMGIPVAAYDIPGIDQLVQHQHTGLLAPFGDQQQLSEHWETLLFQPDIAHRISQQGIAFIEQNFSAKRMASEYQTLFSQLVNQG